MADINELTDTIDNMSNAVSQLEELTGRKMTQAPGGVPEYVKYFIELEDRIPIEQVRTIYDLFSKLSEYKVDHGNTIFQGVIEEAIMLEPRSENEKYYKRMGAGRRQEIEDYIAGRRQEVDGEYAEEFIETLSMMVKMSGYLNFKEAFIINSMFYFMEEYQEYLYISDTEENTYAIKRYRNDGYEGPVKPKKVITEHER